MSCGFVGNSLQTLFLNFSSCEIEKFKFTYALRYLIIIIVGFFPLYLLFIYSKINKNQVNIVYFKIQKSFFSFFISIFTKYSFIFSYV